MTLYRCNDVRGMLLMYRWKNIFIGCVLASVGRLEALLAFSTTSNDSTMTSHLSLTTGIYTTHAIVHNLPFTLWMQYTDACTLRRMDNVALHYGVSLSWDIISQMSTFTGLRPSSHWYFTQRRVLIVICVRWTLIFVYQPCDNDRVGFYFFYVPRWCAGDEIMTNRFLHESAWDARMDILI